MDASKRRARMVFKVPSYLGVHKSELERRIQTRRETSARTQASWKNYTNYVNNEYVAGYYDNKWSRQPVRQAPKLNAKAAKFQQIKNNLLSRRARLSDLLRNENELYESELKQINSSRRNSDFDDLTRRVEEIKKEKETSRLEDANRRKYQMWKRDNPRLRSAEVERRRQEMVDLWTNQNAEKQYEKSLAAERKASDLRNIELEKEKLEIERELENRKRIEKQNILKAELQQQIQELTEREARQNMLTNEEKEIVIEQAKLEREKNRQAKLEKRQKQQEYQNILYRQYRAQILRRAHEIERELEEDLDMLERVKYEADQEKNVSAEKRKVAQQYAQDAIKLLKQKLKEEKDHQAEIDYLYREQAAQWWEKREAEWERERNSRKKLLQSVLSERQNQLTERLEKVKRNKEKILEDREEMLLDIESKKNQIAKEMETQREKRENLISGLNKQIEEKNEQIIAEIEYDNKENEIIAATAREIEDLELNEEKAIMTSRPPVRQAWR